MRSIEGGPIDEYIATGGEYQVIDVPPGFTHSITNIGRGDLVTLFWSSEIFDPNRTDTHSLAVDATGQTVAEATGGGVKVATILGTRPEIIRLARVMAALDRYTQHVLIHTGQNYDYELNQVFFDDLDIREPDYFLQAAGRTPAETIAAVIGKSDEVLAAVKPDAVLILGTRIAAWRRSLPNEERFRFFIWRQVIAVSMNGFRKRSIAVSSTTSATSTCPIARFRASIS